MPGSSPAAFTFSLSPRTVGAQLFEYPKEAATAEAWRLQQQQQQHQADLDTITLLNQVTDTNHADSILGNTADFNAEVLSIASSTPTSFLNPLEPRRSAKDRQDAHRESERRRRENMKIALATLESLVMIALDRVQGRGPNRKLSHAEIYTSAREMIMALKEQVAALEVANEALRSGIRN